jgi:AraC-like DNA-binding protein
MDPLSDVLSMLKVSSLLSSFARRRPGLRAARELAGAAPAGGERHAAGHIGRENEPGRDGAGATLRIFLSNTPQPEGWLGAMADPRVGAALSSLHGDLAHRWTVESLAAAAGMSRTAFAVRFKSPTGTTPLDYLRVWRMTVARSALKDSDEAIAGIAERVGYLSDTAFSAAFKRQTGQSPGRFRTSWQGADSTAPSAVSA